MTRSGANDLQPVFRICDLLVSVIFFSVNKSSKIGVIGKGSMLYEVRCVSAERRYLSLAHIPPS